MANLLLGDEAIGRAALDAGLSGMYAYPGTPSTEIMEYIQHSPEALEGNIQCRWSANEKTSFEEALGMSYAGKRAMVAMKHVGLNVAADPFMNAVLTGVNGGLIITVADDPSMHSSQNEQDSRFYGKFALLPVLEPCTQQEAYDMVWYGFELSERLQLPVMLRITTRLAHSRTGITRRPSRDQNILSLPADPRQFILLPAIARVRYKKLLALQDTIVKESKDAGFNVYHPGKDTSLGIVACGLAWNYLLEAYQGVLPAHPVLKISQYPIDPVSLASLLSECQKVLVLEEGYPLVEELMAGLPGTNPKVVGRLTGAVPRDGELNPDIVKQALGIPVNPGAAIPPVVVNRPPALCKGCSHIDMYNALNEALGEKGKGKVFSDIGCYTLGALEPYNAINTCVDMGASVTMAKGAADAGLRPSVAVIGDSTFTHSGMTGLLDAVIENTPVTIIISDNATTGMTGGQDSSATGRLMEICKGLGVDEQHLHLINPLRKYHQENVAIMQREMAHEGVSVIIAQRECIQTAARRNKSKK